MEHSRFVLRHGLRSEKARTLFVSMDFFSLLSSFFSVRRGREEPWEHDCSFYVVFISFICSLTSLIFRVDFY